MMLTQIRRDKAFRNLGTWAFASAVIASLLIGSGIDRTSGPPNAAAPVTVFGLWVGLALYLAFGARRRGSSLLDLTLPLPARRLWLTHVLAAALGGLVLLVSSLVVLALRGWVEGWPAYAPALAAVRLIPLLVAGHVLAVVALASHRPHLFEVPASDGWAFQAVVLVGILPLLLGLAAQPPGWALVLFAAAGALGWRTWRKLPPALALLPREPTVPVAVADTRGGADSSAAPTAPAGETVRTRAGLSHLLPAASTYASWALVGFVGMLIGGRVELAVWFEHGRYVQSPLALLILGSFTELWTSRLPFFDLLPIGRRRLFALLFLPPLTALLLGYGVGHWLAGTAAVLRPAGPALLAFLVLVVPPWLLFLALYFRLHRAPISERLRAAVGWSFPCLMFSFLVLQMAAAALGMVEPWELQDMLESFFGELGSAAWTGLALLAVFAYLLAARNFERLEAAARPTTSEGAS
ncbi:MAG: hypothetical protein GY719_30500 [bacterium]|nr:hypothetical protein [bacterium]